MKRIILSMLMGMMMLGAMAQEGKLTVSGYYNGLGDSVKVFLIDANGGMLVQEIRAVNGDKLDMTFDLNDAAMLYVFGLKNGELKADNGFAIPALPGEHAVIEGGGEDYTLGGSQFYRDYHEASQLVDAPQAAARAFIKECQETSCSTTMSSSRLRGLFLAARAISVWAAMLQVAWASAARQRESLATD